MTAGIIPTLLNIVDNQESIHIKVKQRTPHCIESVISSYHLIDVECHQGGWITGQHCNLHYNVLLGFLQCKRLGHFAESHQSKETGEELIIRY